MFCKQMCETPQDIGSLVYLSCRSGNVCKSHVYLCLIDAIHQKIRQHFNISETAESRLWMRSTDTSSERLRNLNMTVLDACLSSGMVKYTPIIYTPKRWSSMLHNHLVTFTVISTAHNLTWQVCQLRQTLLNECSVMGHPACVCVCVCVCGCVWVCVCVCVCVVS